VDDADSYEQLKTFIQVVSENSPVRHFIMHARKCFLKVRDNSWCSHHPPASYILHLEQRGAHLLLARPRTAMYPAAPDPVMCTHTHLHTRAQTRVRTAGFEPAPEPHHPAHPLRVGLRAEA
jgi:hypothetical protein